MNVMGNGKTPEDYGIINQMGLSRKVRAPPLTRWFVLTGAQHIFDGVKHSLERLQVDHIDLLQCMFDARKSAYFS